MVAADSPLLARFYIFQAGGFQLIFYQRISSMPASFSAYSNMVNVWASANNHMGTDFKLYSTYGNLTSGSNAWAFCNYDDPSGQIGFPRDCGSSSYYGSPGLQFNSLRVGAGGATTYAFYVSTSTQFGAG